MEPIDGMDCKLRDELAALRAAFDRLRKAAIAYKNLPDDHSAGDLAFVSDELDAAMELPAIPAASEKPSAISGSVGCCPKCGGTLPDCCRCPESPKDIERFPDGTVTAAHRPPGPFKPPSKLLMPREVDRLFRYPRGRSARLARERKLPAIILPDGEIRFSEDEINRIVNQAANDGQQASQEVANVAAAKASLAKFK